MWPVLSFLTCQISPPGTYLLHSALEYSILDSNMHLHHTEGIYTALTSSILGMTDFLALRYILQQLSEEFGRICAHALVLDR